MHVTACATATCSAYGRAISGTHCWSCGNPGELRESPTQVPAARAARPPTFDLGTPQGRAQARRAAQRADAADACSMADRSGTAATARSTAPPATGRPVRHKPSSRQRVSRANYWWLLLGFVGGVTAFLLVKDRDRAFARRLLVFGVVVSVSATVLATIVEMILLTSLTHGS